MLPACLASHDHFRLGKMGAEPRKDPKECIKELESESPRDSMPKDELKRRNSTRNFLRGQTSSQFIINVQKNTCVPP